MIYVAWQDRELFTRWMNKIKLERPLTLRDRVCKKHFKAKEIIKYDSVVLKDGSVFTSNRTRFSLKSGTIPTIFPNYPSYWNTLWNTQTKKRKSPSKRIAPERIVSLESDMTVSIFVFHHDLAHYYHPHDIIIIIGLTLYVFREKYNPESWEESMSKSRMMEARLLI